MGGSSVSAVTFDLWHTLVYLRPTAEERYMRRQEDLAVRVISRSKRNVGATPAGPAAIREAFRRERLRAVAAAERGRTVTLEQQIARTARATGRLEHADPYLNALRKELGRTPFVRAPGALAALRELRAEGYRTGVVSNAVGEPGEFLRPILHDLGFGPLVDAWVFSNELAWAKPAPEPFRAAMAALGSTPARTLHVGDGWVDLEGARRAGLRAAVLYRGLQRYGPSYRQLFAPSPPRAPRVRHAVDRFDQVPPLVRRLLPVPRFPDIRARRSMRP